MTYSNTSPQTQALALGQGARPGRMLNPGDDATVGLGAGRLVLMQVTQISKSPTQPVVLSVGTSRLPGARLCLVSARRLP
jgi:hypothetical protein